jgi:FAD dependent oxidoreductase TIGR03364
MIKTNANAIVVGAGIVGLATARALSMKGYSVTVIERSEKAVGASIRNFGMLWPVGQPDGELYTRAIRSKKIWEELAHKTGLWYDACGSLHVAIQPDEWTVLQELDASFQNTQRPSQLMGPAEIAEKFSGVKTKNIAGGLYSSTETIIDPRQAIPLVAEYLRETARVNFIWGKNVNEVHPGKVCIGKQTLEAEIICICSGADFETLYPDLFASLPVTKCKLQMMRYQAPQNEQRIGTSICGGLSLVHYQSFRVAASLPALQKRYEEEMPEYLLWGIHVMVSQNKAGELTVGDSHEYGHTFEPFDKSVINQLIFDYLDNFVECSKWELREFWNGIYPKMQNGTAGLFLNPDPGVYILNGVGGAGMTLSFGFAEEKINAI